MFDGVKEDQLTYKRGTTTTTKNIYVQGLFLFNGVWHIQRAYKHTDRR